MDMICAITDNYVKIIRTGGGVTVCRSDYHVVRDRLTSYNCTVDL